MPYDFKDVKKFQLGFLSGFLAEKRDIEKKQIEKKVQQEARESAEKLMREQINGYSSVSVKNADFRALKKSGRIRFCRYGQLHTSRKTEKSIIFP